MLPFAAPCLANWQKSKPHCKNHRKVSDSPELKKAPESVCRANHIVARDQVISSHKNLADKVWGGIRTILKPVSAAPSCLNLGISLHNREF